MQQTLLKVVNILGSDQRKFVAEVIGTFIVVVFATGSAVIDAKVNGVLGVSFIAFAPFVGVAICVYLFGKVSMAILILHAISQPTWIAAGFWFLS